MTALTPLDAVFAAIAALGTTSVAADAEPDERTIASATAATVVALVTLQPATRPVPGFFQVFEDHGLDGLIDADQDEAVRIWLGGRSDANG
ncbi:MAG: hypothetical protein HQL37_03115 [Alphaproteobacteria bacterium]|nr:hypothetical protein [Alphaproteobacteria bacterium]